VLFFAQLRRRGRQSEAEVTLPYAATARWRDGLVVYWKTYAESDDALRELGVTEVELEPIAP
jgi:hypothetical protein